MKTNEDIWLDKVLGSADNRKNIGISDDLKKRLLSIPDEIEIFSKIIPMRAVWLAAACIGLLITINIVTVRKVRNSEKQETTFYSEYFSYIEPI